MANMDVPAAKAVHPAERSTRVTGATSEMPRLVSVSRGRYTSLGSAVALRQLPDLDAVRGEHGNEHAGSLRGETACSFPCSPRTEIGRAHVCTPVTVKSRMPS